MLILTDLDDVLNNLNDVLIPMYNQRWDDQLTIADITRWDLHDVVKPACHTRIYELFTQELFDALSPREGAVDGTRELQARGHDIVIVTASTPRTLALKIPWLREHFPHIPRENIIMAQRKDLVRASVLLDDRTDTLRAVRDAGSAFPVAFDRPWNQDWNGARVRSWDAFVDYVATAEQVRRARTRQRIAISASSRAD